MSEPNIENGHPCFDKAAHFRVGRIHVPVAPVCNISCRYCQRCVSQKSNRPGVSSGIITAPQALERIQAAVAADSATKIVGIAGPGDALANEATFETLELVRTHLPDMKKCISTNGLLLPERLPRLLEAGIDSISITVNAVDPAIGSRFYSSVRYAGRVHREDAFDVLSKRQLEGIALASAAGVSVKVNTVLVPELNGSHITEIARAAKQQGAIIMNVMPLLPLGRMKYFRAPTCLELEEARYNSEKIITQFRLCKQCRADACGIPGKTLSEHFIAAMAEEGEVRVDETPSYHF